MDDADHERSIGTGGHSSSFRPGRSREDAAMKRRKTVYQTPEEIEELIKEREALAATLPPAKAQLLLQEIARLRLYADAKRWAASPGLQPGTE
jgi:hypothetical protein